MPQLPERLVTERLVLRSWAEDDLEPLASIFVDERVWRFPLGRGRNQEETASFLERQQAAWSEGRPAVWAAELRATSELVGFIGLSVPTFLPELLPAVEVGWRIHPRYWGRGLATEGGHAALQHAFEELELDRVVSISEPANHRSVDVMRRLGMREWYSTTHPARDLPLIVYRLLRKDWRPVSIASRK